MQNINLTHRIYIHSISCINQGFFTISYIKKHSFRGIKNYLHAFLAGLPRGFLAGGALLTALTGERLLEVVAELSLDAAV